jgi:hypothetical protein
MVVVPNTGMFSSPVPAELVSQLVRLPPLPLNQFETLCGNRLPMWLVRPP